MPQMKKYRSHEATVELLLRAILRNQYTMMRAQDVTYTLIEEQGEETMADFSKLLADVEATRGAAESTRTLVAGLEAKLAEASSNMNDEEDQKQIEAIRADLGKIRESLPQAVVANPNPNPGGSVAGIKEGT